MSLAHQVNIHHHCFCPSPCRSLSLSPEAWLITTGYNVGIVQVVGQALKKAALTDRDNRLVAIGVCKWGCVRNVEALIKPPPGKQVRDLILNTKLFTKLPHRPCRRKKISQRIGKRMKKTTRRKANMISRWITHTILCSTMGDCVITIWKTTERSSVCR